MNTSILELTRLRPRARPSEGLLLRKMELPFLRNVSLGFNSCCRGTQTFRRWASSLPAQSAFRPLPSAKPFRNFPSCSNPKRLKCPGANPLQDAHAALDTAVLTAYGFSAKKDLLAQLLALNQQAAAKIEKGEPVTAPGVPKNYPDGKKLVTEDCIQP